MHPHHLLRFALGLLVGASVAPGNAFIIPPTATASPMPSRNYTLGWLIQTNGEVSDFVRRGFAVGEDGSGAEGT